MLSYIIGEVAEISADTVVIENNGIGFNIKTSAMTIDSLPPVGDMVRIYTYLHVREDAMQIFGFLSKDELEVFKLLLNVNGIGPKGALGILSAISTDDLRFAVLSDDVNLIKSCPGVGAKTAQKLIIELKDKLRLEDAFEMAVNNNNKKNTVQDNTVIVMNEAVEALVSLGYSSKDAIAAVKKVENIQNKNSEQILKEALKGLAIM
ncbi:MAG TPA: Holliday junction branch migration protein RuvA [Eubacterium sp.]|jgi:Holliday junction DNA helicase RuvA|nr:Holliday junction branch migration protein RuvA [Eubacterium sp.]